MTDREYLDISNLTKLRVMQTLLGSISPSRLEDDSIRKDVGIPLQKWIERLEQRLPKISD